MNFIEVITNNEGSKIRRKVWGKCSWVEVKEDGKRYRVLKSQQYDWEEVYESSLEMLEDDWEIYNN